MISIVIYNYIKANQLHNVVLHYKRDIINKDSNNACKHLNEVNQKLKSKLNKLKKLEKNIKSKKNSLCYKVLLKLNLLLNNKIIIVYRDSL